MAKRKNRQDTTTRNLTKTRRDVADIQKHLRVHWKAIGQLTGLVDRITSNLALVAFRLGTLERESRVKAKR